MELIITLIVLIIIWCIAFMVGNKQGANRIVNQIKKDGGYYDMEYTSSAYPILYPTSSVNNDTMGSIGSKPKTQTDYQNEHKAEAEKGDIDFMYNWIRKHSGRVKLDDVTTNETNESGSKNNKDEMDNNNTIQSNEYSSKESDTK